MSESLENKDVNNSEDLFNVSNIFGKRKPLESLPPETKAPEPKAESLSKNKASQPNKEPLDSQEEKQDDDDTQDESPSQKQENTSSKETDYQKEIEKLNRALKDTQKSFHEDRKKLSAYKKAVEKLKAEGTILDEEASLLLDHTRFENEPVDEADEPTLSKYARIWDKEIEYMRKYSTNAEDINQSIYAFQHLIQASSDKERQEIIDELSQYEDNEVELTKQMIEMGRQYNNEIYADIHKAGSIRNLKSILYKKEEELQKKVDKLQKQYDNLKRKYEDYDEGPATRISGASASGDLRTTEDATFDVSKIFASRYKRR